MIKRNLLSGIAVIVISLMIASCAKDNGNPTIKFVPGPGFTGRDTTIKVNYSLVVSLELNGNGVDDLQILNIKQNDVTTNTFQVSGQKAGFDLTIIKGSDQTEKWSFEVIDKKSNKAEISLILTKDPNSEYGAITYYSPVALGAQKNTGMSGFIGFQTTPANLYNLDMAYINQAKIDIMFYSDVITNATLASPGADIPDTLYTGSKGIGNWTVKNFSHFMKTDLTPLNFSEIANDAVIVNTWNDSKAVSKATDLKVNDVWLVKTQSGKKGAIVVQRIVAGDDGQIEFGIKIQK